MAGAAIRSALLGKKIHEHGEKRGLLPSKGEAVPRNPRGPPGSEPREQLSCVVGPQARKALTERQRDLEMKTQQLEIKLSNKTEEDIKKARRKSTQAGECGHGRPASLLLTRASEAQNGEGCEVGCPGRCIPRTGLEWGAVVLCPGPTGGRWGGAALDLGSGGGQTPPRAQDSGLCPCEEPVGEVQAPPADPAVPPPQQVLLPGLASGDPGPLPPTPPESDILFRERIRFQILSQRFSPSESVSASTLW